MTEVMGVSVSGPEDSMEQATATVGHIVEHVEVWLI
jgi:hypothetical protein